MLYYLAEYLTPHVSAFNVFSYHTVRSGGALITGFLFCILMGPKIIQGLKALKVGQHIKKEHVQDLHELHKGKSGTPTMGGLIFIVATLLSLLLWSTLNNRLLIVATAVLCLMGAVGFLDDFIKLRRKRNDGLSARAKLIGQITTGALLGMFAVLSPYTYGASFVSAADVRDWDTLLDLAGAGPGNDSQSSFGGVISDGVLERMKAEPYRQSNRMQYLNELNDAIEGGLLYDLPFWKTLELNEETQSFVEKRRANTLNKNDSVRLNRLLLEAAAPTAIAPSISNLQTKITVPGFKNVLIPLGPLYVVLVILIMVATTNAVNLTDGLDGLAIGASVVSIATFTALAYVVSRSDWSTYLFVTYIPEASELTVFGSALLGTGLGFLWYNAHPAEVFMGDTGSLALGGVMGAMAVLTKQELLLPIVGGLFVLEALSVIIQVSAFKMTGRRIFRMAPLHHHFELKGWSETKVTIRFWIIAVIFALMSLSTLKLR